MDHVFDCYKYPEHKKVTYAVAEFTDNALTWWDCDLAESRRQYEAMIPSWEIISLL